ncbi:MAG: hypothetical protein A2X64_08265 [Ignavibacteria bacterium GWF2_33_9]|nr:MAG: hypothetical protein A2X64_08265 [Ignavibacteria bacterium GWF2_33_9]
MKKIIVCCDGTWNTPDNSVEGIPLQTNIVKIAQAIKDTDDKNITQLTYYDPGIGTTGNIIKRMYDGATGSGMSKNILQAYDFLIRNYEIGDELFLFGFSRGAYTVRSLAGLIRNSSILRINSISKIKDAYKLYKSRKASHVPKAIESILFRKTHSVADVIPIKFIGVMDTVGSLGNPIFINTIFSKFSPSVYSNSFHDTGLSSYVDNAYQALAINEYRNNFRATLWKKQDSSRDQTLEQKWFIGSHSNVGGGYPCTGLSDIALEWMVDKAVLCGLSLNKINSNSNNLEIPVNSRKSFYKLSKKYFRPIMKSENGNESLHESVIERLKADKNYRPKNLKQFFP